MRTTAASSPSSNPTTSSAFGDAGPVNVRPATTDSSSPGGILQAQPPPWAYWVSRMAPILGPDPRPAAVVAVHRLERVGTVVHATMPVQSESPRNGAVGRPFGSAWSRPDHRSQQVLIS